MERFNRQLAAELYRNWFITGNKSSYDYFDKEQIDDLQKYLESELDSLITDYCEQGLKIYRAELPILYITDKKLETFVNEILVIDNTIQSINMPGCMATGKNVREAYSNYIFALIECTDFRYRNGLKFMNIVHTMEFYDAKTTNISRLQLINELRDSGWTKRHEATYNTILWRQGDKVTFAVPKIDIIDPSMVFWYRKHQFQIDAKTARDLYDPVDDGTWNCEICDGDEMTGCQYFDPSECPKFS